MCLRTSEWPQVDIHDTRYETRKDVMKPRRLIPVTWAHGFGGVSQSQNAPSPSDKMKPFPVTDQTGFNDDRIRE